MRVQVLKTDLLLKDNQCEERKKCVFVKFQRMSGLYLMKTIKETYIVFKLVCNW